MARLITLPDRTYSEGVFFFGTEDEIRKAEEEEIAVKKLLQQELHKPDFGSMHIFHVDEYGRNIEYILHHSTRKNVDYQLSQAIDGEPIQHEDYLKVNDDCSSYESWPKQTMAALYNELAEILPMEHAVVEVVTNAA